jgi:hypothetical protein
VNAKQKRRHEEIVFRINGALSSSVIENTSSGVQYDSPTRSLYATYSGLASYEIPLITSSHAFSSGFILRECSGEFFTYALIVSFTQFCISSIPGSA